MGVKLFLESDLQAMFPEYASMRLRRVGRVGATYEAQEPTGEKVLVKLLLPDNLKNREMLLQSENEIMALSRLSDRSFLQVLSSGDKDGIPYLITEFFDGIPLNEAFPGGKATPADAAYIVSRICYSLQHMHEKGMTHFAIKPSNIWVSAQGHLKILQLGQVRMQGLRIECPAPLATVGYWIISKTNLIR